MLFRSEEDRDYILLLPEGTTILGYELEDETIILNLSSEAFHKLDFRRFRGKEVNPEDGIQVLFRRIHLGGALNAFQMCIRDRSRTGP